MTSSRVLVVGAGISGLACARALHDAGVAVTVVDRGRVPGGRMATRRLHDRPVDIGASYFTVPRLQPDDPASASSPSGSSGDGVAGNGGAGGGPQGFAALVDGWVARGLARPWTDTLTAITATTPDETDGVDGVAPTSTTTTSTTKTGPMRYAAPHGLRSLLVDLADSLAADGVEVRQQLAIASVADDGRVHTTEPADRRANASAPDEAHSAPTRPAAEGGVDDAPARAEDGIDGQQFEAVVLAMPDPQAERMLAAGSPASARLAATGDPDQRGGVGADGGWEPAIAVVLGYGAREWPAGMHGAFVEGSAVVGFIADDGDRRGDGAPVLVAHTTAAFARAHLADPDGAIAPVAAEVAALLGLEAEPDLTFAHRWTYARPAATHPEPYLLEGRIGVCGDAWGERSSVSTAWISGDTLGRALAARLTSAPRVP